MAAAITVVAGWAGPALAGPGAASTGDPVTWLGTQLSGGWTYGDSQTYQLDPRLTGGHPMGATSTTPQVCSVVTDSAGNPTGVLRMVGVGICTVSFHLDGDATQAAYDQTFTHVVAPREVTIGCRDLERASDRPNPALVPTFGHLAPWDTAAQLDVSASLGVPETLPPGRFLVFPQLTGSPDPRYRVHLQPCTMTVDPVITVSGTPPGQAARLTVNGAPVAGNRYVFPYGTTVAYSVAPVLGAMAPVAGQPTWSPRPDAWFASSSSGTSSGDTTVTYSTFGDLVAASPFLDPGRSSFMDNTLNQYGWTAARQYLLDGYGGWSGDLRRGHLHDVLGALVKTISDTLVLYLGRPDYPAVEASGLALIADVQLVYDAGGISTS